MVTQVHSILWLLFTVTINLSEAPSAQQAGESTYGNAEISRVIEITSDFTLICDILNYPPVIGHNMPVRIRGLESPQNLPDPGLREFLDSLLRSDRNDPNHIVLLKNIQRGDRFCLIADIEVDGRDLGDHLVCRGLVKRILKVPSGDAETDSPPASLTPQPPAPQPATPVSKPSAANPPHSQRYVASKSSRIFHRADCPHAKRIAEEKKIYFHSREQAAAGRRPCKACNP